MTSFSSTRWQTSVPLAELPSRAAPQPARTSHRRARAGMSTACLALAVGALAATPALAASGASETFSSTGAEQTFTVPFGVTSVHVRAIGEAGEEGESFESISKGGDGAIASASLPVTPGEKLFVEVAALSFNGGGYPAPGGGIGGGASDVRTISSSEPETLESRLLVAAGGGGGGGGFENASGGKGGNAGSDGAEGVIMEDEEESSVGGVGGDAGTLAGGGAGGERCDEFGAPWDGQAGTLGSGGEGGDGWRPESSGGGGGGGYYGGGGGEGQCEQDDPEWGAGGGGGGGSSYVSEEASSAFFGLASSTTAPSVTISYATPATATASTDSVTFPETQPISTVSAPQAITLTNEGGNPLTIDAATFTGSEPALSSDHPEDFLVDTSGCLGALAYQASCQIEVRFLPQSTGTSTATLKIAGDMSAGPTTIALTGTGGTLPQGAPGEPGPTGPQGAQGEPGPSGSQGAQGLQGQAGATGPTGATGETGHTETQGPQGPAGSQGPPGPQGEPGPRGLTATYICHPRQRHGSYQQACFVTLHAPPTTANAARVSLRRDGITYAHGSLQGSHGGALRLAASRRVPAGRYTLVVSSKLGVSTSTVKIG
jgi:hypothetical protein